MIYCPHCNKPSARMQGPCPHCGRELSADKVGMDPASPEITPQVATEPPRSSYTDQAPMSSGVVGHSEYMPPEEMKSNLDLASVNPPPILDSMATAPSLQRDTDEINMREMARFGAPQSGIVGSLRYWLHVRTRLKELAVEHDRALENNRSAMIDKRNLCAQLGKKGHEIGLTGDSIASLISAVSSAEAEHKNTEKHHLDLTSQHKDKIEPIEETLKKIEAETEPLRKKETQTSEDLNKLHTDRKRIEARLKRAEIDIKNMEDLIGKRQESYADLSRPKEERDKLLSEIAAFDNRRPGLIEQINACEAEMAELEEPIAKIQAQLTEIREVLNEKQEKTNALESEMNRLSTSYSQADIEIAKQMESKAEKVEEAWAAVGMRIINENIDEPKLAELKSKVIGAITGAAEAQRKVELLSQAQISYDSEAVTRAKRIAGAVVATAVGLIILLIFLIW